MTQQELAYREVQQVLAGQPYLTIRQASQQAAKSLGKRTGTILVQYYTQRGRVRSQTEPEQNDISEPQSPWPGWGSGPRDNLSLEAGDAYATARLLVLAQRATTEAEWFGDPANRDDIAVLEGYFGFTFVDADDDALVAHRRELEAQEPDIRERVAAILDAIYRASGGYNNALARYRRYFDLRERLLVHMASHRDDFRSLQAKDFVTLYCYFVFSARTEVTVESLVTNIAEIDRDMPELEDRVLNVISKVKHFEP